MRKVLGSVLAASLLAGVVLATPAAAIINSYRVILSEPCFAVAAAPGALYAGIATGVKKSTDGGATWALLPGMASKVSGLAVDPRRAETVYAATASGLYRSADAGQNWSLLNAAVRYFVTVSPFDSNVLFADNLKSSDGGATWRTMSYTTSSNVTSPLPVDASLHIKASADPANPGFMLTSVREDSYRSADGGETWQPYWYDIDSVEIDPTDARYYYLGGRCGRGLWRYFPGGYKEVWAPEHVHGLAVDPTNHARVFAVTDDSTGAVSTDFGATWKESSLPGIPFTTGTGATYSYSVTPFEGRMAFDVSTGMVLVAGSRALLAKNSWCADADNDGYSPEGGACGPLDCDDTNPALRPNVQENCWDGIDNNCNGALDMADAYCVKICGDQDKDSFISTLCRGTDCNDTSALFYPGAPEICDWRDNDCDGRVDEDQPDLDGDGYSSCGNDCNDADAAVFPGAPEIARDGVDQDCNGYDLTIEVTKASYSPEQHGALHVQATSVLADSAWLYVDYYGSMEWQEKKGNWKLVTTAIGDKPETVSVCGYEGCVEAPVVR